MEEIGARWAFRVCSVFAIITCIVYAIAQRFMPPVKMIYQEDTDTEQKAANNNELNDVKNKEDNGDESTTMTKA